MHTRENYADRTWPMIILGALMFIPGVYHIRIAYCAFRRYPGYSFADIPEGKQDEAWDSLMQFMREKYTDDDLELVNKRFVSL
uniref:Transmembrane protein 230 n=1 Tax=Timema cristinae TaxID=61476 RepID=A0A7R9D0F8_TIMCR|nr:unnamed protein product [Timema cristinae]